LPHVSGSISPAVDNRPETGARGCRLCGAADLRRLFAARGHWIARCGGCGFVQLERRPTADELSAVYTETYFKKARYHLDEAARREQERRIDLIKSQRVRPGARVLDVGCAAGDFVIAAERTYAVWGIDPSPHAIATAKNRHPAAAERLHVGGAGDAPVPDNSFDAVTLWDVVEHLDDPVTVLRAASAKLKPGGLLFLSTPNVDTVVAKLMGPRWAFMTPPEHIGFYSRATLQALLGRCGFLETDWRTCGKWINLGFLAYKARRVFPELIPRGLVDALLDGRTGRTVLYIPTGDIQYVAAKSVSRAARAPSHE
jgi:2-polyprenyl-3-methyl-5-hydroxy-6-metoxy-1,4-benzoquinol methylase